MDQDRTPELDDDSIDLSDISSKDDRTNEIQKQVGKTRTFKVRKIKCIYLRFVLSLN